MTMIDHEQGHKSPMLSLLTVGFAVLSLDKSNQLAMDPVGGQYKLSNDL